MAEKATSSSEKTGNLSTDLGLKTAPQPMQGGYEALLEDIFGLNIRSLRTIRTLFSKPADYFAAARSSDWVFFRYTPSPRLWLGLVALTVATRFIWGDPNSQVMEAMTEQARTGFEAGVGENADKIPPIDWAEVVARSFDIALVVQPFLMLAMMLFLAVFVRFWGEAVPYVVRVRYLFGIIIPATVINFGLTFLLLFIPKQAIGFVSIAQLVLMFGLYILTAALGPFKDHAADSRYPKAVMLAIILFVAVMITNFIAQGIGIFVELMPALREAIATTEAAV